MARRRAAEAAGRAEGEAGGDNMQGRLAARRARTIQHVTPQLDGRPRPLLTPTMSSMGVGSVWYLSGIYSIGRKL